MFLNTGSQIFSHVTLQSYINKLQHFQNNNMSAKDIHFNLFTIINTGKNLDHFIIIVHWIYFNIQKVRCSSLGYEILGKNSVQELRGSRCYICQV